MKYHNQKGQATQLVVVDPRVESPQQIIKGVKKDACILILDPQENSIEQITKRLQKQPKITSLHLISHGSPGLLYLGDQKLSLATLADYATNLKTWAKTVKSVVIYGCQVAAGEIGQQFLTRWHQITGTALTASTKLVGNSHKGGSWQLDYQLGDVVEELALTPLIQESYRGTFDPIISFSAPTRVIIEAELTILTFRFSLSEPPPSSGVEVAVTGNVAQSLTQLDLLDVSQTGGDPPVGDFDFSGFFFNITSGTASVRVPAFQDGNQEQPYDVTYTLQSGEGYTVDPSARSVTITFADTRDDLNTDPDPPTDPTDPTDPTPPVATQFVQLIGSPELLVETEQTNAILTIVLPEDIPEEGLTVFIKADRCNGLAEFNLEQLTVTGGNSLVFNEDGSGFAVTVTEPTATISIPVLNDGVPEGLETVRFTLESGEDYTPDPNADEATFSLVDSSILPLDFNTQANTVQFVGSPLQTINAKFSLIGGDLNRAIEVGIFDVDDDTGGIDYRWGWDY